MQTITLDQLTPGSEFGITLSVYAPIKTDAIYYIAEVGGRVLFSDPESPILHTNRRKFAQELRAVGLVMRRE